MVEQQIIERLSKIEAKFDSHDESDNKIFNELEKMHDLHFMEQKQSNSLLIKTVTDLTNIAEKFRDYVADSTGQISSVDRKIEAHIKQQQEFHIKIWWIFIAALIGGTISSIFKLVDSYIK